MDKDEFIKQVESMSVVELNELVKSLEEKFGVSAAAMTTSAGSGQAAEDGAGAVEEKDSFTVVLKNRSSPKNQINKNKPHI